MGGAPLSSDHTGFKSAVDRVEKIPYNRAESIHMPRREGAAAMTETGNLSKDSLLLQAIAYIHTAFPEKFGIPRQSGLVPDLPGEIVFTPEFRYPEAVRGLEGFSHIWLLWGFSANPNRSWSPTVRPPRLGGNTRMGVFASRSPVRPNPIGLSCVRLEAVLPHAENGPLLQVSGVDLMDGTPIYDIKPYLPFNKSHPEASGGYATARLDYELQVSIPPALLAQIPPTLREPLRAVLAQDPRPAYQQDPNRIYGMEFAGLSLHFTVDGSVLTLTSVEPQTKKADPAF